jgi:hypothetical protein
MKSRPRDEKFKMVMVRLPKVYEDELVAIELELGIKAGVWARMALLPLLEARRQVRLSVAEQSTIVNS